MTTKIEPESKAKKSTESNAESGHAQSNVGPEDWSRWVMHLRTRPKPLSVRAVIISGKTSSLTWGFSKFENGSTQALVEESFRTVRKNAGDKDTANTLECWVAAIPSEATLSFATECLAWSQSLPLLASELGADRWCELLDTLIQVARDSAAISLDANPLVNQLLSVELSLTLCYQFPEIQRCDALSALAKHSLSQAAIETLDGRGLPHAKSLSGMRPLLACWTRCGLLNRAMKCDCFDDNTQAQFEWLIQQSLRLSTHDGSQVFLSEAGTRWSKRFIDAVLTLSDDTEDKSIAAQALRGYKSATVAKPKRKRQPNSAYHSEWSQTAFLRTNWSRKSELLAITYADRKVRSELRVGAATIWSGGCDPVIRVNRFDLKPESEWDEVCWHSDKDVDYVELEIEFQGGWKLQRQVLLARKDRFLFLGDAVIGTNPSQIEYRSTLPLAGAVRLNAADETREGFLYDDNRLATVLPLALPEWRSESTEDRFNQTDRGLELCQHRFGAALYAPLFIDLKPSRLSKELTWRQLTVADRLEIQPRDVAVGYRVQIGKAQWLL